MYPVLETDPVEDGDELSSVQQMVFRFVILAIELLEPIAARRSGARPEDLRLEHAAVAPRRTTTRRGRHRLIEVPGRSQSGLLGENGGPYAMNSFARSDRMRASAFSMERV